MTLFEAMRRKAHRIRRVVARIHPDNVTCRGPRPIDPYAPVSSSAPIVTERRQITDESRDALIDCLVRRPAASRGEAPWPIIVISLPANWSPAPSPGMTLLARDIAAAGYVLITVRHVSSDRRMFPVWIDEADNPSRYIRDRVADVDKHRHRFLDIRFLLDALGDWNRTGSLAGLLDRERIGLAGHSLGAVTALSLAGQRLPPEAQSYRDDRVKAAVAYSNVLIKDDISDAMFADLLIPCLHMTGTKDRSFDGGHGPEVNLLPYRLSRGPHQYALLLRAADHQTFSGLRADQGTAGKRERLSHQLIKCVSLAFWDAYLKDDANARRWLDHDLKRALGRDGKLWSR